MARAVKAEADMVKPLINGYGMNQSRIMFTQSNASPFFSKGGNVAQMAKQVKAGNSKNIPFMNVVEMDGKFWTLDHRRFVGQLAGGAEKVNVEIRSIDEIWFELLSKFNPVEGGEKIIVTSAKGGGPAKEVLRELQNHPRLIKTTAGRSKSELLLKQNGFTKPVFENVQ